MKEDKKIKEKTPDKFSENDEIDTKELKGEAKQELNSIASYKYVEINKNFGKNTEIKKDPSGEKLKKIENEVKILEKKKAKDTIFNNKIEIIKDSIEKRDSNSEDSEDSVPEVEYSRKDLKIIKKNLKHLKLDKKYSNEENNTKDQLIKEKIQYELQNSKDILLNVMKFYFDQKQMEMVKFTEQAMNMMDRIRDSVKTSNYGYTPDKLHEAEVSRIHERFKTILKLDSKILENAESINKICNKHIDLIMERDNEKILREIKEIMKILKESSEILAERESTI